MKINPQFYPLDVLIQQIILRFEVHFFDFSSNLYKQSIRIEFLEYIRSVQKFESSEALYMQIRQDETVCRNKMQRYLT